MFFHILSFFLLFQTLSNQNRFVGAQKCFHDIKKRISLPQKEPELTCGLREVERVEPVYMDGCVMHCDMENNKRKNISVMPYVTFSDEEWLDDIPPFIVAGQMSRFNISFTFETDCYAYLILFHDCGRDGGGNFYQVLRLDYMDDRDRNYIYKDVRIQLAKALNGTYVFDAKANVTDEGEKGILGYYIGNLHNEGMKAFAPRKKYREFDD